MNEKSNLVKIVSKGSYSSMLEYVIWRYWKDTANTAVGEQAADELASLREELDALRLVADAARTGQGLDDALDALDALKGEK
jgi:hypothetical protein